MAYTHQQTVFTLSMLANLGDTLTGSPGTIEPVLRGILKQKLLEIQHLIGTWTLVWGPAVAELPTSIRPDNTMFVVRNGGELVVAIAGTNPYSFLDWLLEDFLVTVQSTWRTGHPTVPNPMISLGTRNGLSILQTLKPGSGQPGAGVLIKDFLASQTGSPVTVNVAGHSLGGALSPTLALWINDLRSDWDPKGNATLAVLPSAGPTAGNQSFAQYSDSQIGGQVTRLYNPLDIVPKAWTTSDLQQIPSLYTPAIPTDPLIDAFSQLAVSISEDGGYTQINRSAGPIPGSSVNTSIIVPFDWFNPFSWPFPNFLTQVVYQHVDAYIDLLGVSQALQSVTASLKSMALLTGAGNTLARLQSKLLKFQSQK